MKLVITVGVIAFALLVLVLVLLAVRTGGIRRRDYQRMKDELNLAVEVIEKIDQKADEHRDIYQNAETPLATDIRELIRNNRTARAAVHKRGNDEW